MIMPAKKQKKLHKSKTLWFNMFMAAVGVVHGSVHLLAPLLEPDVFVMVSLGIGMVHAIGGIYLRTITRSVII